MQKTITFIMSMSLVAGLAGCADMGGGVRKQDIGMATGAVLGGVLGNQVGQGTGRTVATIGGAVLGAFLGSAVGKSMDDTDKLKMSQALETARTNQTSSWQNPDAGVSYQVTPTKTYTGESGMPCREYITKALIDGKWQKAYGTACRNADGSWRIVS